MPSEQFSILTICTGNVCRSPVAERLLVSRLDAAPVTVSSAGIGALVGMGIDGPSAQALKELGLDPGGHRARQLETAMIESADLILAAGTAHRSAVVRAVPLVFRRAFTMREFARLGSGLEPLPGPVGRDSLVARVRQVADQRGLVDPPNPGADEIGDPFGAALEQAWVTVGEIAEAVDGIVAALGFLSRPR